MTRANPAAPKLSATAVLVGLLASLAASGCREPPPPVALHEVPREARGAVGPLDSGALGAVPGQGRTVDQVRAQQGRVRREPRVARGYVQLARLFVQLARETEDPSFYVQAGDAVRRARALDERDLEAQQLEAQLLLQDHRFREARDAARRLEARALAAGRGAPLPETLGVLSDALLELGDYDGAAQAAQRMVDARPDSQSYVRAAWLRWMLGDAEGAIDGMRLAMDAMPRLPEVRAWITTQMGVLHWNTGDLAAAERYFTQALAAHPPFGPAHAGLARIALARGDAVTAAREAEAAVRASPVAEHQWLAGDALTAAGRAGDAARYYSALERIGRRSDPRTLALYYAASAEHAAEAVELARAEHENRQDVFTDDVLAWALFRAGQLGPAAATIARARRLGTRDARILFHDGMIRLAQGDRAGGVTALQSALAANPHWDTREPSEARRTLAALGAPEAQPSALTSAVAAVQHE